MYALFYTLEFVKELPVLSGSYILNDMFGKFFGKIPVMMHVL